MRRAFGLSLCLVLALTVSACKKQGPLPSFRETLGERVMLDLREGRTNDAIRLIEESMGRDDCRDIKPALFAHALDLRSRTETPEAIRIRYLKGAGRDPVMAAAGFRGVESGMHAAGRLGDLSAWCRSLLHVPAPVSVRVSAYRYSLSAARSGGNPDDFSMLLAQAISSLPQDQGVALVESVSNDALQGRDEPTAKNIADLLEKGPAADSEYARLGQAVRIRFALVFSDSAAAGAEYRARFARLGGGYAGTLFGEITAAGKGDPELVAGLSRFVLRNTQPADQLFGAAASRLIGTTKLQAKSGPMIGVLKELRELRMRPEHLARELGNVLNDTMTAASKEEQKDLLDLAWPLLDEVSGEADKHDLCMVLLDGCALAEDYTRAIALLDKGIPQQDARSLATTRHKILAHVAMAAKDYLGAITNLEAFIDLLEPDRWIPDPMDGPEIPTAYIKALNLARLGELWSQAGDREKSAVKYRESRAQYEMVLKNPRTDERLKKKVAEQLAALPADSESPSN